MFIKKEVTKLLKKKQTERRITYSNRNNSIRTLFLVKNLQLGQSTYQKQENDVFRSMGKRFTIPAFTR